VPPVTFIVKVEGDSTGLPFFQYHERAAGYLETASLDLSNVATKSLARWITLLVKEKCRSPESRRSDTRCNVTTTVGKYVLRITRHHTYL